MATLASGDGNSRFEQIKRTSRSGIEYWSSRELASALEYTDYRNFEQVISKAKEACSNSGNVVPDHFVERTEMVRIGSGAERALKVVYMDRFACYLAIQNADPTKTYVALGQTYFAIQTRRQELADQVDENERRLMLRNEMKEHNKSLASAAREAGVERPFDYAVFQDHGYQGLYGGLKQKDIHKRKNLKSSEGILDHMNSTELAANLFRATQTEEKLRREGVKGKERANKVHREIGTKVRKTIEEIGGTMPENLPVAESIKKLEAKKKKELGQ